MRVVVIGDGADLELETKNRWELVHVPKMPEKEFEFMEFYFSPVRT